MNLRALDFLAATLLGWTKHRVPGRSTGVTASKLEWEYQWAPPGREAVHWQPVPRWSSDKTQVVEFMDAIRSRFRRVELHAVDDVWICQIEVGENDVDAHYEAVCEDTSAPLAVMRAFLEASGYEADPRLLGHSDDPDDEVRYHDYLRSHHDRLEWEDWCYLGCPGADGLTKGMEP